MGLRADYITRVKDLQKIEKVQKFSEVHTYRCKLVLYM